MSSPSDSDRSGQLRDVLRQLRALPGLPDAARSLAEEAADLLEYHAVVLPEGLPPWHRPLTDGGELSKADLALWPLKTHRDRLAELEAIINRSPAVASSWRRTPGKWIVEFITENIGQFGCSATELLTGRVNWTELILPADRERVEQEMESNIRRGRLEFTQQYRVAGRDGRVRWVEELRRFLADIDGAVLHAQSIYLDITDRKHAEQQLRRHEGRLRSLAAELSLAEERERRRLAVDLHDGPIQLLLLGKIKLDVLRRKLGEGPLVEALVEVAHLIDQAERGARSLTFQLSPPALYDLGLVAALEWLADDLEQRFGLHVELQEDRQGKALDERASVTLFRCAREALLNVVKHAGVDRAVVRIRRVGDFIELSISDRGAGFDADQATRPGQSGGFGLFSIIERLEHLGGQAEVHARPGEGTIVFLRAPVPGATPDMGEQHDDPRSAG